MLGRQRGRDAAPGTLNAASVRPGRAPRGREGPGVRGTHWPQCRGLGEADGRTWPEQRGAAASGAGREHGPGPAEQGAPAGTPRRLVSARAARPGPNHQARPQEDGDKVRPGGPAPATSWHPALPSQPSKSGLRVGSDSDLSGMGILHYSSAGQVDRLGPGGCSLVLTLPLVSSPGFPFPGFSHSLHTGWVGLELGWSW